MPTPIAVTPGSSALFQEKCVVLRGANAHPGRQRGSKQPQLHFTRERVPAHCHDPSLAKIMCSASKEGTSQSVGGVELEHFVQ